jgi:hypothetical protein
VRTVSAVLFDLDGVLVESREATERVRLDWASKNGIDVGSLRSAIHGVRSVEVGRALRPELDAVAEAEAIELRQAKDVDGLQELPGVLAGDFDAAAVAAGARRALTRGVLAGFFIHMTKKSASTPMDRRLHRRRKRSGEASLPGFIDMDGDGPRFGAMIGFVAVVVATVILVFFGIGYALGRLFL